jgi:solute carrier family 40 (iron-regulated transporter), member 1
LKIKSISVEESSENYNALQERRLDETDCFALFADPHRIGGRIILDSAKSILLSRFLTRSGDQAWDFALPLTLISLFPTHAGLVIAIFLASKFSTILILPRLASIVDEWPRMKTALFGTSLQSLAVVAVSGVVFLWAIYSHQLTEVTEFSLHVLVAALIIGSVAANLGSNIMEIAVGNDWIPDLIPPDKRTTLNSRMRQIDLFTEVASPVVAGSLLLFSSRHLPFLGFFLVSAWNAVSFVPEMFLLRNVLKHSKKLQQKSQPVAEQRANPFQKMFAGWSQFVSHKAAPAMFAYSLLWLSALSPHGVILTTFLKDAWKMTELDLGVFRGAGAVFGLIATVIFPAFKKKFGLLDASAVFIGFQAAVLLASMPFFLSQSLNGWAFLILVLFSRIGLYGFSLGELEIRQNYVLENSRGIINGVASALNNCATLCLFAFGALFPTKNGFVILTTISVVSVSLASGLFWNWRRKESVEESS